MCGVTCYEVPDRESFLMRPEGLPEHMCTTSQLNIVFMVLPGLLQHTT